MSSANLPTSRTLLRPGAVAHLLPALSHAAVVVAAAAGEASVEWLGAPPEFCATAGEVELRVGAADGAAWRVGAHLEPAGPTATLSYVEVLGPIEDREYSRLELTLEAEVAAAGPAVAHEGWGHSIAADISAGGVALTGVDLAAGDVVLVRATVPVGKGSFDLEARAQVARVLRRDDGVAVCGLRWVDLDWATREHLSAAVVAGHTI